ncbi:MAG: hypothetical protein Fur002_10400 [Anaerolineales bacterium]
MSHEVECTVSANLLLGVAQRLFSYDKAPLALALVHVVLEQRPEYPEARRIYQMFTGKAPSAYPMEKHNRMIYDFETSQFIIYDAVSGTRASFSTFEEAEEYLKGFNPL